LCDDWGREGPWAAGSSIVFRETDIDHTSSKGLTLGQGNGFAEGLESALRATAPGSLPRDQLNSVIHLTSIETAAANEALEKKSGDGHGDGKRWREKKRGANWNQDEGALAAPPEPHL
jgi:hypothetical protein